MTDVKRLNELMRELVTRTKKIRASGVGLSEAKAQALNQLGSDNIEHYLERGGCKLKRYSVTHRISHTHGDISSR